MRPTSELRKTRTSLRASLPLARKVTLGLGLDWILGCYDYPDSFQSHQVHFEGCEKPSPNLDYLGCHGQSG